MGTTPATHEIPEWALDAAAVRSGWRDYAQATHSHCGPKAMIPKALRELARMIAQHETPPVDPLLIEARELVAHWYETRAAVSGPATADRVRNGDWDSRTEVEQALAALKRGLELATKP